MPMPTGSAKTPPWPDRQKYPSWLNEPMRRIEDSLWASLPKDIMIRDDRQDLFQLLQSHAVTEAVTDALLEGGFLKEPDGWIEPNWEVLDAAHAQFSKDLDTMSEEAAGAKYDEATKGHWGSIGA